MKKFHTDVADDLLELLKEFHLAEKIPREKVTGDQYIFKLIRAGKILLAPQFGDTDDEYLKRHFYFQIPDDVHVDLDRMAKEIEDSRYFDGFYSKPGDELPVN